jgi:hypothetical protein
MLKKAFEPKLAGIWWNQRDLLLNVVKTPASANGFHKGRFASLETLVSSKLERRNKIHDEKGNADSRKVFYLMMEAHVDQCCGAGVCPVSTISSFCIRKLSDPGKDNRMFATSM